MARPPRKKRREIAPKKRLDDTGSDTMGDTKLVNAMESNPEFFKDPLLGKTIGKCTIEKFVGEGKTATVYLTVPEKRSGVGKVTVSVQERTMEYRAVADNEGIPTGSKVVVVGITNGDTLEVVPYSAT